MNEVEYSHIKDYAMLVLVESNSSNDYGLYKGSAVNHHYIYENIANVISVTESMTTNALEGIKLVDIIERIYQLN
jgi:UDP-N-acetyl-2-amino-2-deoxyglucuronate dehydrogenase